MANSTEIILRWAYSELTSERFRKDMADAGVPAELFDLADTGAPYDEKIAQTPERRVPLLRALYHLRGNNVAMLLNEEHEVQNWTKNDVLKLRSRAGERRSLHRGIHAGQALRSCAGPAAKVAKMTDAELKGLSETPGIVGFNGSAIVLLDGTSRTLARLRRGDTVFPMWTPASLSPLRPS